MTDKKTFYITTPIYYVNDVPHVGSATTTLVADAIARYHRQRGESVFFLTGTDENATKVANAAAKKGLTAKQLDTDMRIIAVADVYDALSAKRPYRDAMPLREVFAILDQDAGVALDARCIDVLKSSRMTLGNLQQNAFTTASALAA